MDCARLEEEVHERISGADGLAPFVAARSRADYCGPVLIGNSHTPVGARQRFPALSLTLPHEARLSGMTRHTWRGHQEFEILVLTNYSDIGEKELGKPLLEPVLFLLALKAGAEALPGGVASSAWLGKRGLSIHLAHRRGISTFAYAADDFRHEEAHAYLVELLRDLLDRGAFDLLPLDLIIGEEQLRQAYTLPPDDAQLPRIQTDYPARLEEAYEEEQENESYARYCPIDLVKLMDARVPPDAFAKVRRRFKLLDAGPARQRQTAGGPERG
jgi:hypothetical protein